MRILHRYLSFFLIGIMSVYAMSGIVLIFRDTDFLKRTHQFEKQIASNLEANALGKALDIKRLKVDKVEGDIYHFKN